MATVNDLKRHKSVVNTASPEFQQNKKEWQVLIDELSDRLLQATNQGKKQHLETHIKRGQLLGTGL